MWQTDKPIQEFLYITWNPLENFQGTAAWTHINPFLFPVKREKKVPWNPRKRPRDNSDLYRANTNLLCNEWIKAKNEKYSKTATDLKDSRSRVRGLNNYHFLTRSTESITRLTSSLARLRVSKRIMPLLFIMAAILNTSSRIIHIWETVAGRGGTGAGQTVWDGIVELKPSQGKTGLPRCE